MLHVRRRVRPTQRPATSAAIAVLCALVIVIAIAPASIARGAEPPTHGGTAPAVAAESGGHAQPTTGHDTDLHDDHADHGVHHGSGGHDDPGLHAAAGLLPDETPGWYGGFLVVVAGLFVLALLIGTTAALVRGEVPAPGETAGATGNGAEHNECRHVGDHGDHISHGAGHH